MRFWSKALPKCGLLFISILIEVKLFPFIPVDYVDPRMTKEVLASFFVVAIILCNVYAGKWAQLKNPWLFALLFYCFTSPFTHPVFDFPARSDEIIAALWGYKPLWHIFLYFLFGWAIASTSWDRHDEVHFRNIFIFLGGISAIYACIQCFLPDQLQHLNMDEHTKNTTHKEMTAFFAHPNFASSFIVITLPFMYRARKYLLAIFCTAVIILIDSKFAILGAAFVLFSYIFWLYRKWAIPWCLLWGVLLIAVVNHITYYPSVVDSSGRFVVWGYILQDLLSNPYAGNHSFLLTGYGLGAFSHLFMNLHGVYFAEAHSLFFEFLFNAGIIGVVLLFFSIFWLLFKITPHIIEDEDTWVWYCTFLALLIMSFGYFFEHIEPHRYIWCLVSGILYHKLLIRRAK